LAEHLGVDVQPEGKGRLRLAADAGPALLTGIATFLASHGGTLDDLSATGRTLEEVYLRLVDDEEAR
jgi:hypothetical protein